MPSTVPIAAEARVRGTRGGAQAGLDVLLTDAAVGLGTRRFIQPRAVAAVGAGIARHPRSVARRARGLGSELARVAAGRSGQAPAKGDRRFTDEAWAKNWLLHRMMQGYLTVGETVDGVISDADLDWQTERQARFAAGNVLDALAPTNFPLSNPAVLRALVEEGGANLVRGARRFAADVSWPPRLPQSVDTEGFEVGGNLAATDGSVVLRTEVFELIQYEPTTAEVREVPLLLVPPTINKYYVLDLAPGRSMVEYLVASGQQVFIVSWRNPGEGQGHFDLDTYADAVLEAREAVADITGERAVHLNAACSGGIITAGALGHLAADATLGDVASLTLFVCALDNHRAGTVGALTSREAAAAAVAESARRGYLDGQALAGVFAWLRPNDLVWSYVVNNYLLGRKPPAFDVLYWNQDTVRLAAGLHRDFVRLALDNSLTRAGGLEVLGSPVDLGRVDVDSYIVAGMNDHIVPWENAYQSTQLLGGEKRFVLSTSGHIQALVNPPAPDSRSSYRVAGEHPADPKEFLDQAAKLPGSWWPDYVQWLEQRSGDLRPAPKKLGGGGHRALGRAPGTYVLAS
ncbi:MAG: poly[(R)-3-hydroxyalkanoate] polymerase subunit PhaC [Solirubrobacteraceae bacterium]|nr:poly[(R)-3-hydroxyalkanoate] polymerase subunit PhaC [Solirubrobacteraceae bacterium]